MPLVHDELRKIARRCLRGEHVAQSLQATALVNEAYLRLVDARLVNWQNRIHFLAMSARLMRRVLVDAGRARGADKRGGDAVRVSLSEALGRSDDLGQDVVALHDALEQLERVDPRKGRLVDAVISRSEREEEEACWSLAADPDENGRCEGVAPAGWPGVEAPS